MKIIYCDGSSLGNPGRGGFGVVALDTDKKLVWEYGEAAKDVTNNQMELAACLCALKVILQSAENAEKDPKNLHTPKHVSAGLNTRSKSSRLEYELRLDSKYVIQGVTEWSKNWSKNNWKNAQKKEVANKEIWQKILSIKKEIEEKNVTLKWTHVYGHTGEEWNERCDEIARGLAGEENIHLQKGTRYKE